MPRRLMFLALLSERLCTSSYFLPISCRNANVVFCQTIAQRNAVFQLPDIIDGQKVQMVFVLVIAYSFPELSSALQSWKWQIHGMS